MGANRQQLADELKIIEQAKTDDQAFRVLYDFYFSRIYYFILKRVGHKESAEDIVAATFMKAFTNLKKFKPRHDHSFSAWLYRIAANNLTDYFSKQSKQPSVNLDEIIEPADEKPDGETAAIINDESELVRSVLGKMADKDREILELKFFNELGNKEIAEILNISANNAGVLLYRALKKFDLNYKKHVNNYGR